jgi:hypothetical protein
MEQSCWNYNNPGCTRHYNDQVKVFGCYLCDKEQPKIHIFAVESLRESLVRSVATWLQWFLKELTVNVNVASCLHDAVVFLVLLLSIYFQHGKTFKAP